MSLPGLVLVRPLACLVKQTQPDAPISFVRCLSPLRRRDGSILIRAWCATPACRLREDRTRRLVSISALVVFVDSLNCIP